MRYSPIQRGVLAPDVVTPPEPGKKPVTPMDLEKKVSSCTTSYTPPGALMDQTPQQLLPRSRRTAPAWLQKNTGESRGTSSRWALTATCNSTHQELFRHPVVTPSTPSEEVSDTKASQGKNQLSRWLHRWLQRWLHPSAVLTAPPRGPQAQLIKASSLGTCVALVKENPIAQFSNCTLVTRF